MTQEQKNQRLAEWAGWFVQNNPNGKGVRWAHPDTRGRCGGGKHGWGYNDDPIDSDLPNYFTSLDAVHELEMKLRSSDCDYVHALAKIVKADLSERSKADIYLIAIAAAAQRAEALGLTLGLWKEGE